MDIQEKLRNYAELIVGHGLNVQQDQVVNITAEAYHRDFVLLLVAAAYERGARYVNVDLFDPRVARTRLQLSNDESLTYVPNYLGVKYKDLVKEAAANLRLVGSENPDILADQDPQKVNTVRLHQHLAIKYFYDEGIGKSLVHWTVAGAATPKWGQKVFPDLSADLACEKLWDEILRIARADKEDCLNRWKEHNQRLRERAKKLTSMKIQQLHFTGPETDLVVELSPAAIFKGGSDTGPHGVEFEPNIPTEEVFTTPDCRGTRGKAQTTRPFFINGRLVKNLYLEFENGQVSSFRASDGEDTFREYIDSDEGSKYLGEVALVGIDSPVYQSNLVFQEILYDENAACHIAVGSAYKFCLEGGENMTRSELAEIGCNDSTVHTDMMISSEQVDVIAKTYDGTTVRLIEHGAWVI